MKLPTKVQTAVDTLTAFDVHPNLVAPLAYRLYLKIYPDTPPPLWGASKGYWFLQCAVICIVSFILVMLGFAYVLQQNNTDNIISALLNPVLQTMAWTIIGLVSWMAVADKRDDCQRENTNLGLPAWENFHAAWRPDVPYVQRRANPRLYWLASLKNEALVGYAEFAGVLSLVMLALFMPNKVHLTAEVVSIVYLIICIIAYQNASNGKLMSETPRARNIWFIQNGFWIGFLLAAMVWDIRMGINNESNDIFGSLQVVCVICLFLHMMDRFRFEQNKSLAARIEKGEQDKQIAEMRVQALKAQIEPHFIFNTLAHLKALIREDARAAETMADDLADFLRASTKALGSTRVTLTDECALASSYLELVKRRMGGRLSGNIVIQENAGRALLPPWILLTLVENAVKHGIEPKPGAGRIDVSATCVNESGQPQLQIMVSDNGVGFGQGDGTTQQSGSGGSGVGLANVRERLHSIYGNAAALTLRANTPSGVVAEIVMPVEMVGEKQ